MATYFTSDQHITLRHPERGERFSRFMGLLNPGQDRLVIAGDLVDFWFTAREAGRTQPISDPGLIALQNFVSQNGQVILLAGNHDQHLGWYFEREFGLKFTPEPFEADLDGFKVRVVHGHLLGGRSSWKGWMESRFFLKAFEQVPDSIADRLAGQLKKYNSRNRRVDNLRHYMVFERYVQSLFFSVADITILGHIHQTIFHDVPMPTIELNETKSISRIMPMAVLGHWFQQSSWLKLENGRSEFYIWSDNSPAPEKVTDSRIHRPI